jgi:hypothetical protein
LNNFAVANGTKEEKQYKQRWPYSQTEAQEALSFTDISTYLACHLVKRVQFYSCRVRFFGIGRCGCGG